MMHTSTEMPLQAKASGTCHAPAVRRSLRGMLRPGGVGRRRQHCQRDMPAHASDRSTILFDFASRPIELQSGVGK